MHNPPDDGNYQFGALCFWLNRLGIHRSPGKSPWGDCRIPGEQSNWHWRLSFRTIYAGVPWSQCLQSMETDGTYGDQITLQAAGDLYITTLISPSASIPFARVQLGHYAEQHGEHYILCRRLDFSFGGRATPGRKLRKRRWFIKFLRGRGGARET